MRRGARNGMQVFAWSMARIGRAWDVLGGRVFALAALETGAVFDDLSSARVLEAGTASVLVESVLGPVLVGASVGSRAATSVFITLGRVFSGPYPRRQGTNSLCAGI